MVGHNENLDDIEIDGNRWFTGEICQVIQGVFLDNFLPNGTGRHKNIKVRGNLAGRAWHPRHLDRCARRDH